MKRLTIVVFGLLMAAQCMAQSRGFVNIRNQAKDHIALVIGNSAYPDMPLTNPTNDAADVSQVFKEMGFVVETVLDANREQMAMAIDRFSKRMPTAKAAVFYYAGHGMQVDGQNYLIPIATNPADQITDESQVSYRAINAAEVLTAMESNRVQFAMVVLDACRNNSVKGSKRGKLKGLAAIDAPVGSLVMYATKAGDVADDGTGRNSPFTAALLQHITTPGLDVNLLPSKVTSTVHEMTGGKQTPGTYVQLTQSFTFVPLYTEQEIELLKAKQKQIEQELKDQKFKSEDERKKRQAEYDKLMADINKVENYDQDLAEISRRQAEVEALDKKIAEMKSQSAAGVDNLDAMLAIVAQRKKQKEELEALKLKKEQEHQQKLKELEEKKRLAEQEKLRKALEMLDFKENEYQTNLDKYHKIAGSEFGQDLKESAWNVALKNLGVTRSIPIGDEAALRKEIGLPDLPSRFTETVNGVSFKMIFVEGGSFRMGDTFGEGQGDEKPVHDVILSDYYLGETEVTQALWRAVMGASSSLSNPSYFKNCDECPVEGVSWEDIVNEFLPKLNRLTGRTYVLPTEAQWEFAARERGRSVRFGNGQDILRPSEANFYAKEDGKEPYSESGTYRGKTMPVKSFSPNSLGLYDMAGNVWEWCSDWYGNYSSSPTRDPQGPASGAYLVYRGGSWVNHPKYVRSSLRDAYAPTYRSDYIGFRLAVLL